jgi:hypothetical protein
MQSTKDTLFFVLITIFKKKGNTWTYISVQLDVTGTFIQIIKW